MEILVGDVFSIIKDARANLPAIGIVRDVCRARPNGFQFMPKFKKGMWDGYISLMHSFSSFPTGLLPLVTSALQDKGYTNISIVKEPVQSYQPVQPNDLHGITLRDYQVHAANAMLQAGRGIAKMATNSGKTEVMAAIIKALSVPTVVIVHRKELMYQTAERFKKRLGVEFGLVGDGVYDPRVLTVAMIQTLSNHDLEDFAGTHLVMVDECHHGSSDTMTDILIKIPGHYRFGFSGTPLKHDVLSDMKLIGHTGIVVADVSNDYLIRNGYSAKPVIKIHTLEGDNPDMSYQEAYDALIVKNKQRNKKIKEFAKDHRGTVLILVNRIDHGKTLQKMIKGSKFVCGSDSTEYRQSVLEDMAKKDGVYIASPIFDEGIDVPALDVVIVAGGGLSQIKLLQRIGRGLRKKDGDNVLTVYDFIDDTNSYLLQHSSARIDTYVRESFETELV